MHQRKNILVSVLIGIFAASVLGLTGDEILRNVYDSTNTALRANIVAGGGGGAPFVDTTSIVKGSVDATKQIRFEVDGLTTATVRVLTPQNADYTLAGTTVTLGGTGLTSGTSGGILGFTGTTTLASSAALVANSVVLGGGAGATPKSSANFTFDPTNFRLLGQNLTTASDNSANMVTLSGTMPTSPTIDVAGLNVSITGAGSAGQNNRAVQVVYGAGYTGSSESTVLFIHNANAGTGTALNLGTGSPAAAIGLFAQAVGSGDGTKIGGINRASASTSTNIGAMGIATAANSGQNIAGLFTAGQSTQATNFKNIPLYATLSTSLITGSNISAVAILDNGAVAAPILNA